MNPTRIDWIWSNSKKDKKKWVRIRTHTSKAVKASIIVYVKFWMITYLYQTVRYPLYNGYVWISNIVHNIKLNRLPTKCVILTPISPSINGVEYSQIHHIKAMIKTNLTIATKVSSHHYRNVETSIMVTLPGNQKVQWCCIVVKFW